MSRVRPVRNSRRSALLHLGLALAAGSAALASQAAFAQEGSLRGPLEPERADPLSRTITEPLAGDRPQLSQRGLLPQYRPIGTDPLAEEQLDEELDRAGGNVDAAEAPTDRRSVSNRAMLPENLGSARQGELTPGERRETVAGARRQRTDEELDRTAVGTVPTPGIDAADLDRNIAARPASERATAIETLQRQAEDDPFQPPGIRVGTFTLRPSLEQGIEWNSNASGTAGGSSDFLSESTLRLNAASDWSRHSASLDAFGAYRTSITGTGFSEFRGGADARLNLELGDQFILDGTAGFQRRPESASSPATLPGTTTTRPIRQTLSGSLGLEKGVGKLRLGANGRVDRDTYGDAGGVFAQRDRNNTLYALALRGGYEISPALTPFVEVEYGRRIYDNALDSSGYRRSANRYGLRAGAEIDMGEKLNGELSAGWLQENPDDPRLGAVSGLSAAANLLWSPIRGTTVALTGSTQVEGSTVPGSSGSILYSSTLGVTRELRANVTGTATIGADWRRYASTTDTDLTLSAEASLTWWFNRYAGLRGRARHEQTTSTIAGRDAQSTGVYLGVTLRR